MVPHAALSPEVCREIDSLIDALPSGLSYVATGSLVEGLGNENSDIDLYAISDGPASGPTVRMGIRETHYVDVEFMTLQSLADLCERVMGCTWRNLEAIRLRDIDRFYRVAIGIPVSLSNAATATLSRFDKGQACAVFAKFAAMRAYEHWCGGGLALRTGWLRDAALLLREAWMWHAAAVLAGDGEGYASLKWTAAKAARRYGRDSDEFRRLVRGFACRIEDVETRWAELGSDVIPPADLGEALDARSCRLAEGVQIVGGGPDRYLRSRGGSIARIDAAVAATCECLASRLPWHAATANVAASLGLRAVDARVALWIETEHLRTHEFLVATPAASSEARL